MAKNLFGTDGIRGVAGEYPLDPRTVFAFGVALGAWAKEHSPAQAAPEVLIGMDTRESGPWLASHVAAGLARQGVVTRFAGLITTPGVAYLTRRDDFVAGVMISASHNPYQDNGLKVFDHSGFKLPDAQEHLLEERIFALLEETPAPESASLTVDEGLDAEYVDFLASTFAGSLDGLRLVLDCAHGAASHLAPELFTRLGASVRLMGCAPDGRNINAGCGALHVGSVREQVLASGAAAGVAFDGDADRCMMVSASGKIIDGDHVLYVAGRHMLQSGHLPGDRLISTVMSNIGLERALQRAGIGMTRTPVGDKYVLEEMLRTGATLGGEQSGHVIFREFANTGDGLLTALRVLEIARGADYDLDALTADLRIFPQILVNVRVKNRRPLEEMPAVREAIRRAEIEFGDAGRVLVRFSGTEPLARVMVEGPDDASVKAAAERIASVIREELGG
ncbi:MAG TPA: phosphoglucosamine mutase [Solibacterales bacterium]|nr:phosphoglucosamine mutase [Bryobacterales bacterium]